LPSVVLAVANPWVAVGIVLLLGFFASYMNALSWADLTYVLPATSISYVLLAFIARFALQEHISASRWIGIALISGGVAFAAGGPALTRHEHQESPLKPKAGLNGAPSDIPPFTGIPPCREERDKGGATTESSGLFPKDARGGATTVKSGARR
jgi:hypothetical protein